jgi:Ni,Fe-hydrogenase I large subunit
MASVRAIEDAYANAGEAIELTQKAKDIRELTLSKTPQTPLKGAYAASIATKALASFAGQWPHSSYMIPGGVTCDPTHMERIQAQSYLDELINFFEKESLGVSLEKFLSFESCKDFNNLNSDISKIEKDLIELGMNAKGFSYDRFVVLGEHSFTKPSKLKQTRSFSVDKKYVSVSEAYSPNQKTYAKNASYKNDFYETGPLSRAMATNIPIIKNMHRRFKDSAYSRVMARIFELAYLLKHASSLISSINLSEESLNAPSPIKTISADGIGIVEAPRGPLVHKISIKNGLIQNYKIITPTQWNIGSSTKSNLTPAQKAMIGVSTKEALFIFRTFDVCSVCTTH